MSNSYVGGKREWLGYLRAHQPDEYVRYLRHKIITIASRLAMLGLIAYVIWGLYLFEVIGK